MVTITLPDGTTMPGRLITRRETRTGWVYDVVIAVPADTCQPIDGAAYTWVPTVRRPGPNATWIIAPIGRTDEVEVHYADCCATLDRRKGRVVSRAEATAALDAGVQACRDCWPEP